MKVLLLGSSGQLGNSLISKKPRDFNIFHPKRDELDISNFKELQQKIIKLKPDWVINAAAYTNVDQAENNKQLAFKINRDAPKIISETLKRNGGNLLHISTDFVFDGKSNTPYLPKDPLNPISIYGLSKAEGEFEIKRILDNPNRGIILRTSWLMGPFGKNFAKTILELNRSRKLIKVVSDQIGCPTSSISLAEVCWKIIEKNLKNNQYIFPPIMHWRDDGITSWYEIAKELGNIGLKLNKFKNKAKVEAIKSIDYKTLAKRPAYSALDVSETKRILKIQPLKWQDSLFQVFKNYD